MAGRTRSRSRGFGAPPGPVSRTASDAVRAPRGDAGYDRRPIMPILPGPLSWIINVVEWAGARKANPQTALSTRSLHQMKYSRAGSWASPGAGGDMNSLAAVSGQSVVVKRCAVRWGGDDDDGLHAPLLHCRRRRGAHARPDRQMPPVVFRRRSVAAGARRARAEAATLRRRKTTGGIWRSGRA